MNRLALRSLAAAGLAVASGAAPAQHGDHHGSAGANLADARGQVVGSATAARRGNVVRVSVSVRGFARGTYGVHLHQAGRCEAPDFASAGPHWNPAGRQHGRLNPRGPHLGDLPNLVVRANGMGRIEFDLPVPAGTGRGRLPLLDADGTSIVLHAAADDERTDPSGNSGARIACGAFAVR